MDKYLRGASKFASDHRLTPMVEIIAGFGRKCAAGAYRDAARDVECVDAALRRSGPRHGKPCPPCNDCVQAARLVGKAEYLDGRI